MYGHLQTGRQDWVPSFIFSTNMVVLLLFLFAKLLFSPAILVNCYEKNNTENNLRLSITMAWWMRVIYYLMCEEDTIVKDKRKENKYFKNIVRMYHPPYSRINYWWTLLHLLHNINSLVLHSKRPYLEVGVALGALIKKLKY